MKQRCGIIHSHAEFKDCDLHCLCDCSDKCVCNRVCEGQMNKHSDRFVECFRVKTQDANEWEIKNASHRKIEDKDTYLIYFKSHDNGKVTIMGKV